MPASWTRSSEPASPITPRTPGSFQQFLHGISILNSGASRNQQPRSKRSSSDSSQSFPDLLPVLPNPFEQTHPALRSRTSTRSMIDPAVASPASTLTRFSAMASNPFHPRASLFPRRVDTATVLDYGGNVPIDIPDSGNESRTILPSIANSSRREWPSAAGRRRRRTRKRSFQKSSAPILFPAMQSKRVRVKMLHSIIFGSLLILLLITYFALQRINANLNSFQVFFILMFILLAIALAHCLLRLFLLIHRWNLRQRQRGDQEKVYAPSDRAIPVILARDEEIGIGGSISDDELDNEPAKSVAPPPPAYGLWRGSVRADPNLLHWQRVHQETQPPTPQIPAEHIPRPPSYTPPVQHAPRMDGGFF